MKMALDRTDHLATVGGRIRAVRLARRLTHEVLAGEMKISRVTISQWESNKVKNFPYDKMKRFAELTEVPLDWLMHRTGEAPQITLKEIKVPPRAPFPRLPRSDETVPENATPEPVPQPIAPNGTEVAEIKAGTRAHATELDLTPQAKWSIPREVLTIGFNCDPDQAVIKRVLVSLTLPDGTTAQRGDYLLIDASRNVINEAGLYYVADPDGREVKRVSVMDQDGVLVASDKSVQIDATPETSTVLGRAMAVFRAL